MLLITVVHWGHKGVIALRACPENGTRCGLLTVSPLRAQPPELEHSNGIQTAAFFGHVCFFSTRCTTARKSSSFSRTSPPASQPSCFFIAKPTDATYCRDDV